MLNIDIQSVAQFNSVLKVYDIIGQLVNSQNIAINKGLNKLQVDYSSLARASYILTYIDNFGIQHQVKFIKD